jgi:hypothetical protein
MEPVETLRPVGRNAMADNNHGNGQHPREEDDEDLRELYAKFRREFTAADLQKFTEIEDGIPFEQIIAELEEIHRKESGRKG